MSYNFWGAKKSAPQSCVQSEKKCQATLVYTRFLAFASSERVDVVLDGRHRIKLLLGSAAVAVRVDAAESQPSKREVGSGYSSLQTGSWSSCVGLECLLEVRELI